MALKNHAMEPGRETYLVSFYNLKKDKVHFEEWETEEEAKEYAELAIEGHLENVITKNASIRKVIYINHVELDSEIKYRY